jgi:hypothetical protein
MLMPTHCCASCQRMAERSGQQCMRTLARVAGLSWQETLTGGDWSRRERGAHMLRAPERAKKARGCSEKGSVASRVQQLASAHLRMHRQGSALTNAPPHAMMPPQGMRRTAYALSTLARLSGDARRLEYASDVHVLAHHLQAHVVLLPDQALLVFWSSSPLLAGHAEDCTAKSRRPAGHLGRRAPPAPTRG